ncbi:hypothetical protein AB0E75_00410 [Streptomyces griseoviridis]|jgi:hypothetical protein|uniref:Secreted protein n=3 Tax=Streptomyces TaxID=1883 RepID=A0A918G5Q9_STRGD|nr:MULTISPECIES: hypothetical protein [Streptomyces]MDP9681491.1 hypothetical protein [Streptomyces griseoviridis]GGS20622.1 secreted protein [Streptomyces niveoruber]
MAVADDSSEAAAAADIPPYAVEDFQYPGAAAILEKEGIELKKGDGHIVLAACDGSADQIRVLTVAESAANRKGEYCFNATAKTGYLTLELPRVFALETGDHPISADLTAEGTTTTTTVKVAAGGFEPVGEGTVGGARSVLVEIRVTG